MKITKANAAAIRRIIVTSDIDWLHITDGYEGTGKTTFTWQLCKAVDPTFNPTRNIIFTEDQFREALRHSKPGQAYMLDEGALIMFKRDAMTKSNKKIIRLLTTIRAKNLFIAINAPDFKNTIDKYTIEHRARSVARVVERGWVHWFTKPQIGQISIDPKTKKYHWPEPRYRDSFGKVDGADWREYKRRKEGVVDRETDYLTVKEFAGRLNKNRQTIYDWINRGLLKAQKIGKTFSISYTELDRFTQSAPVEPHNKVRVT